MCFVRCFVYFTQLGVFSRVFLSAGANPACSNSTEQRTECLVLLWKTKDAGRTSKSSTRCSVPRKSSITMINEHQFSERIYKTDLLRNLKPEARSDPGGC